MSNQMSKQTEADYLEEDLVFEAAGHRLTLFLQVHPRKMFEADAAQIDRFGEIQKLWFAAKNLKEFGRFVL